MTDIIERLRKWCHAPDAVSAQDLMDEAANKLEASRQQVRFWKAMYEQNSPEPKWIDRSLASPSDPNRQCLLYTDKLEGFIWIGRKGLLPGDVTHWQYLPEPPNAETSSLREAATTTPSSAP
jgi:hypothetical protein